MIDSFAHIIHSIFKYSLIIVYLASIFALLVAIFTSRNVRYIIFKIHGSKLDRYSWARYGGSYVLIVTMGVVVYQATFSTIDVAAVTILSGIAIAGKVTQSGIHKDK